MADIVIANPGSDLPFPKSLPEKTGRGPTNGRYPIQDPVDVGGLTQFTKTVIALI